MTSSYLERWGGCLRLIGSARGEPHAVVGAVDDALSRAHASITDVHFFSGIQVTLHFEIAREDLAALGTALSDAGVRLDPESAAGLAESCGAEVAELAGTLALTLLDGDPDLKREIPAVPG